MMCATAGRTSAHKQISEPSALKVSLSILPLPASQRSVSGGEPYWSAKAGKRIDSHQGQHFPLSWRLETGL